jgi:hypothetical protein
MTHLAKEEATMEMWVHLNCNYKRMISQLTQIYLLRLLLFLWKHQLENEFEELEALLVSTLKEF